MGKLGCAIKKKKKVQNEGVTGEAFRVTRSTGGTHPVDEVRNQLTSMTTAFKILYLHPSACIPMPKVCLTLARRKQWENTPAVRPSTAVGGYKVKHQHQLVCP